MPWPRARRHSQRTALGISQHVKKVEKDTNKNFRLVSTTIKAYLLLTVVIGLLYPAAIWVAGRIWSDNADGSMIYDSAGKAQGSELITQEVTKPGLFYPRPSAAGDDGYDTISFSTSNVPPYSKEFQTEIEQRRTDVTAREGIDPAQVPVEAVTASSSGLNPHISEKYARLQAPRMAKEHNLSQAEVEQLISENSEKVTTEQGSQDGGRLVNIVKLDAALTDRQ